MKSGILVYDIGTTSVKSALFTATGTLAGSVSKPYKTEYPQPGWAEQDPDLFWEAAVLGTRELLASPEAGGLGVEAIGLTGHMNGCLPVDAAGRPTHRELIHSDSRSGVQCDRVRSRFGEDAVYRKTGNPVDEHLSLSKFLWLKDERREAYDKTAWVLNSKDYVRFKLTGVLGTTDFSDASLTGIFDPVGRTWAWDMIDTLGLRRECFPVVRSSIEQEGGLSKEAATILGFPAGIPVSYGGGDGSCATRGAGVTGPEEAYVSVGSSAWTSMLAPEPRFDPLKRMQNFFDLDGRSCNVCGTTQTAGIAVDWALGLLFPDMPDTSEQYRAIEKSLEDIPIGSEGVMFLPYLMGERTPHWDAAARGVFAGLSLAGNRRTMLRAVYEGVSFAIGEIVDIYADLSLPIKTFTLLGGGIRSPFWRTLICDVAGIPMRVHPFPTHAISLGAAMAAGVSVGLWKDLGEATVQISGFDLIEPDLEKNRQYKRYFSVYKGIYRNVKPVFDGLKLASNPS